MSYSNGPIEETVKDGQRKREIRERRKIRREKKRAIEKKKRPRNK